MFIRDSDDADDDDDDDDCDDGDDDDDDCCFMLFCFSAQFRSPRRCMDIGRMCIRTNSSRTFCTAAGKH